MIRIFEFIKSALLPLTFIYLSGISYAQDFEWAISIGGEGYARTRSAAVDDQGNLFVIGTYSSTVDFDPGIDSVNITSKGGSDIFLVKYDIGGNYLWVNALGGFGNDGGSLVQTDALGNVYIVGSFQYSVDFDPGPDSIGLTTNGSSDIFMAKYDNNGNYIWAKNIGGPKSDGVNSFALDGSGNIYLTGSFYETVDFDPGSGTANLWSNGQNDVFIAKYDNNGNYVWAKSVGASYYDYSYSIDLDASGNVYITGDFHLTVDFDPGPGTASLTANNRDIFIAKYDKNGNYIWAKNMGGGKWDIGHSISVDAQGNLYITGLMNDTADFEPGVGTAYLISNGSFDIFLAKYDTDGNYLWANNFGSYYADQGLGICTDGNGNIYIIGHYQGTFIDFDPGSGYATISSNGGQDVFVAHYDTDGNYIWVGGFGGSGWELGNSIVKDRFGNVYAVGTFQDTVDFNFNDDTVNLISKGSGACYVAKYSGGLIEMYEPPYYPNELEFSVYPNPSAGQLNIEINSMFQGPATVTIIDLVGRKVYSEFIFIDKSFHQQLDVSHLAKGVFFLVLETVEDIRTKKMVIH